MKIFPVAMSFTLATAAVLALVPPTFGQYYSSSSSSSLTSSSPMSSSSSSTYSSSSSSSSTSSSPMGSSSSSTYSSSSSSSSTSSSPMSSSSSSTCGTTCRAFYGVQGAQYVVSRNTNGTIKSIVFGPASGIEADKWIDAKEAAFPAMIGVYTMTSVCNSVDSSGVETMMPCEQVPSNCYPEPLLFVRRYMDVTTYCPIYNSTTLPLIELGPLTSSEVFQAVSDDWNMFTADPLVECQNAYMEMYIH